MRLSHVIIAITAIVLISSCTVSKQVKQLNHQGNVAFESGDYQKAFNTYEELIGIRIDKNKKVDPTIYQKDGIAAWEVKQTQKAIDYLEKSKQAGAPNEKSLFTLAKAYLEIDNLSREINNLEEYQAKFPNGENLKGVQRQLFTAYVRSENWDLAEKMWPTLSETHEVEKDSELIEGFLKLSKAFNRDEKLVPMAKALLKLESNNLVALEALALHYYDTAEKSYQVEMKAYEKNRTNRQYRQLLNALEVINSNFKISRDYFERLYKLDPNPKYATYLGNIYTRFDNKKQANYYYRKAKE